MISAKNKPFMPDCSANDIDIDLYYTKDKTFGHFAENGRAYVITDRNTPRVWVQYLCNDKIRSAVSNTGKGYIFHARGINVTKHYEIVPGNYMPRNYNGQRYLMVCNDGVEKEFFTQSDNFICTVRPGYVVYDGDIGELHIQLTVFVPLTAPSECWNVTVSGCASSKGLTITASQEVTISKEQYYSDEDFSDFRVENNMRERPMINTFTASKIDRTYGEKLCENYGNYYIFKESLVAKIPANEDVFRWNIVSSVIDEEADEAETKKYIDSSVCDTELASIKDKWTKIIEANYCELPDKNAEYFLNVWLKNNLYLTFRYDRGNILAGCRDCFQDSWGTLLVEPETFKEKFFMNLSYMYSNGKCLRGIDRHYNKYHDRDDYSDAPIWIPFALNYYIKMTDDFGILEEKLPFFDSDETATVEEHIYRSLDYLYKNRGKNGLVLVRNGDWADGLGGINRYGKDATSVWLTTAAYNAQNLMAEIYRETNQHEKADEMKKRSAEYKKIVNEVGWDGNWLTYQFFEDGEPIGSAKNLEGKIWLNPQTWGIFTGIVDDKKKIEKITRAVSKYLDTPFGAMICYPPYMFYGERCGRVQRQRPGEFLNAAVYNHAASFKVFSDVKREAYEEAFDTFSRCLPNHPDNSDTCRTSEPFSIGNVYYGPNHPRYGMNLFSWYTATPAWLIHGGFDEILGVKPSFNGLEIEPHIPEEWNEYTVKKLYRGTKYDIHFIKTDKEKGIFVDGEKQSSNIVLSNKEYCKVTVMY